MKLLIITQVIDTEHPILGFFHRWVQEFAKHCEHVHVICLEAGKHSLPANVTVHSLGKEKGVGKFGYLFNFYKLIWKLRHEYDNVFVHMNQIYVILGAPFWRALNKKVGLWYTHGTIPVSLKIAEKFINKIFTASSDSFKLKSKKVYVTGHGIDTTLFAPRNDKRELDLITVGRIAKSKNLEILVDILKSVRYTHNVTLTIVGKSVTEEEKAYEASLKAHVEKLNLNESVNFVGMLNQSELPDMLSRAKVFVTTAQNGSLDKAMLEAMVRGLNVVSMAPGSASLPLGANQTNTQAEFATQVLKVLELNDFMNQSNSDYIKHNHSLQSLVPKILDMYVK